MSHPVGVVPTVEDLQEWANCSVPDCEYRVTHDSDKCYPHTYGWDAVRRNLQARLRDLEGDEDSVTLAWVRSELKRIERFR